MYITNGPSIGGSGAGSAEATNQWLPVVVQGESAPAERHGHTICSYRDKYILFGGTPDGSSGLNDIWIFDTRNRTWSSPPIAGSAPAGRYRHSAAVVGSSMYIYGGYRSKCLGDLYALDIENLTWSQPNTYGTCPSARSSHSACVWGSKMVIFGGSGHKYSNELYIYDANTQWWSKRETTGCVPSERWCHSAVMFGRKMHVFGGSNDRRRDAHVYVLDLSTLEWTRPVTDGCGPQARQLHTAAAIGQCMIIFGGWIPHAELNDVHVLNTRTLTWTRVCAEGSGEGGVSAPPHRQLHASCTSQGKMVVFGGYSRNKRMNDFYEFTLANTVCSLQDLCVDLLVAHLPQTLPHLHLLSEELLASTLRKMGQAGLLSHSSLGQFLTHATLLTELSLVTCSDVVDDAWIDSLVQCARTHGHADTLLKVDLSHCRRISDEGLRKLAQLRSLRVVLVDGESGVTPEGVHHVKLTLPAVTVVKVTTVPANSPALPDTLLYHEL